MSETAIASCNLVNSCDSNGNAKSNTNSDSNACSGFVGKSEEKESTLKNES